MNKKIIITLSSIIVAGSIGVYALNMKNNDPIIAMVNKNPVYQSKITDKLDFMKKHGLIDKSFDYSKMDNELRTNFIKSIIVGDLIEAKAKEANIENSEEFKKLYEFEKSQLLQKIYIEKMANEKVTEQALKSKYDNFVNEQKDQEEVKAAHIVFDNENEAKEMEQKITSSAEFDKYLEQLKKENKPNKGGELGYFKKDQLPAPLSDAAFTIKIGEISKLIKTDFGWHIIKVLDKRKVSVPEFKELKDKFKSELYADTVREYVMNLEKENQIEIVNNNGEKK